MTCDPVTGVVSPRRWSIQPVPAGLATGLAVIVASQARVMDETPWPAAGWALVGIVVAIIAAGLLAAGWWWHSPDWTRRGYAVSTTVFGVWAGVVFHASGPLAEVGFAVSLAVVAVFSWRAENEARWLSRPNT